MSKIVDMIRHIDKTEAAAWKGEPLVKRRTYTPEQQEKLDFFKSMASAYCVNDNKNPDELIDTIVDPVPGITGDQEIVSMIRWECVVDHCDIFSNQAEMWWGNRGEFGKFAEAWWSARQGIADVVDPNQLKEATKLFDAWWSTRWDRIDFIKAKMARENDPVRTAAEECWDKQHAPDPEAQARAAEIIGLHEATNEVKH